MIPRMIRLAKRMDERGQYDLADRVDRLLRLASPMMTLYHGTRTQDLNPEDLEPYMPSCRGGLGSGVYFGERPETAEYYAGDRGKVLRREMDIKNPLIIDAAEGINYRTPPEYDGTYDEDEGWQPNPDAIDSILVGQSVPPFDVLIGGEWHPIRDGYDLQDIGPMAMEAGHDAVIARYIRHSYGGPNEEVLVLPTHDQFRAKHEALQESVRQYLEEMKRRPPGPPTLAKRPWPWEQPTVPDETPIVEASTRLAGYSTELGTLRHILKQGYDPYDYEYNLSDFLGQNVDVGEGEGYDWLEKASPEQLDAFRQWNENHPMSEYDPAGAPAYETLDYRGISEPRWQVHFTDEPEDIASQGFSYGHPEIEGVQLTTHYKNRATRPGFNFSFDADSVPNGTQYGKHAVIFPSGALNTYHHGDEERQNIFWGSHVDPRMIFPVRYEEDDGGQWCWIVRDWNDRDIFRSPQIRDCVGWVERNWRQLLSTREKVERKGRLYRATVDGSRFVRLSMSEDRIPVFRGVGPRGLKEPRPSEGGVYGPGYYMYTHPFDAKDFATPGGGILVGTVPGDTPLHEEQYSSDVVALDDLSKLDMRGHIPTENTLDRDEILRLIREMGIEPRPRRQIRPLGLTEPRRRPPMA